MNWKAMINTIKRNYGRQDWWRYDLPGLCARFIFTLVNIQNDGVFVMREDWDNLIILDACRYSLFEKYNYLNGQ